MQEKMFDIGLQFFAEDEGATGQEVAEPADDVTLTGEDIDDDELDIIEDDEEVEGESDGSDGGLTNAAAGASQTPEQNAAFAEVRRKAEAEAKLKAQTEAAKLVDNVFADMGLTDPYTGKRITNKAEYDAYKQRHESETVNKELGKAGITREAMDAIIASHPAIKQAEEATKAYREQSARVRLDEQLKEISALDSTVQTADDLINLPTYPQIREYVRKGLTIAEGYKLANMDKLTEKKTAAAAQSAINKVASKAHLEPSTARGQGDSPIPRKQYEQYKLLRPDWSDKQIRADWAKHNKKYMK